MKTYQIVSDLMHTRKINWAFMDVYSMRMNIVENCVLDSARDNLLSATMNFFGLQIRKFLKKGVKVNWKLGMIKLEVSTIVAWNFDNKDCISAHPGVKVNWRHPVVRDLRLDWTFCQKDKLIVGELWFKGRFG